MPRPKKQYGDGAIVSCNTNQLHTYTIVASRVRDMAIPNHHVIHDLVAVREEKN